MKEILILLISLFAFASAKNLPICSNDVNATSNKCGGMHCSNQNECQSYSCSTLTGDSTCAACVNDETSIGNRCEGLPCMQDAECYLNGCYKDICDTYGEFSDGWRLVGALLYAVILIPLLCCATCIGCGIWMCIKARNRRLNTLANRGPAINFH